MMKKSGEGKREKGEKGKSKKGNSIKRELFSPVLLFNVPLFPVPFSAFLHHSKHMSHSVDCPISKTRCHNLSACGPQLFLRNRVGDAQRTHSGLPARFNSRWRIFNHQTFGRA